MRWRILCARLVCLGLAGLTTAANLPSLAAAERSRQQEVKIDPSVRYAEMNILLLDDGALGLPPESTIRSNFWEEWDGRIPVFLDLLQKYMPPLVRAQGASFSPTASLFALEVSASMDAEGRAARIADYLQRITDTTKLPTTVLARSSAGNDHLRLVFVSEQDCPPKQAAEFLERLAEVSPPVAHGRIMERLGPFQAPPTVVFDPRGDALLPPEATQRARFRWGMLEMDRHTYLLPHYVLHALSVALESRETGYAWTQAKKIDDAGERMARFDALARQEFQTTATPSTKVHEAMARVFETPGGRQAIANWITQNPRVGDFVAIGERRVYTHNDNQSTRNLSRGLDALSLSFGAGVSVGGGTGGAFSNWTDRNRTTAQQYLEILGSVGGRSPESVTVTHASFTLLATALRGFNNSGPSGPRDVIQTRLGGIRFTDSVKSYTLDLSGRVAAEIDQQDKKEGGLFMGRLKYFDHLPLLWIIAVNERKGTLPAAVPQFLLAAPAQVIPRFSGPWSLEPVAIEVTRDPQGVAVRAKVVPAETCSPVDYEANRELEKEGMLDLVPRKWTWYQPDLSQRPKGGFRWELRHGVVLEFNAQGLLEAIESPFGERATYVRKEGLLLGQHFSDGRRLEIRYTGRGKPQAVKIGQQERATYEYDSEDRLVGVQSDLGGLRIGYDAKRPIIKVARNGGEISFQHDEKGRLSGVQSGQTKLDIEYIKNTVVFKTENGLRMEWVLGASIGAITGDEATLFSLSTVGRVVQGTKGAVEGSGPTRRFIPKEGGTVELVGVQ